MVSSILLSIAPLYSMAILNTRKSEDFTVLLLLLLTLPIVLGAPISLLHLLVFKKNISADTARKLIFFPLHMDTNIHRSIRSCSNMFDTWRTV